MIAVGKINGIPIGEELYGVAMRRFEQWRKAPSGTKATLLDQLEEWSMPKDIQLEMTPGSIRGKMRKMWQNGEIERRKVNGQIEYRRLNAQRCRK